MKATWRNEHYYNVETQMDAIFKLSDSPHASHVLHIFPFLPRFVFLFFFPSSWIVFTAQSMVWQLSQQMFEKMWKF